MKKVWRKYNEEVILESSNLLFNDGEKAWWYEEILEMIQRIQGSEEIYADSSREVILLKLLILVTMNDYITVVVMACVFFIEKPENYYWYERNAVLLKMIILTNVSNLTEEEIWYWQWRNILLYIEIPVLLLLFEEIQYWYWYYYWWQ